MAGQQPYESLVIKINADISNANKGLNEVSSAIVKLQKVVGNVNFDKFKELRDSLHGLAKADLSKLAKELETISNALKSINGKDTKNILGANKTTENKVKSNNVEKPAVAKQPSVSTENIKTKEQPSISADNVEVKDKPSLPTENIEPKEQSSVSTESVEKPVIEQPTISTENIESPVLEQPSVQTENIEPKEQPLISVESITSPIAEQPTIPTENVKTQEQETVKPVNIFTGLIEETKNLKKEFKDLQNKIRSLGNSISSLKDLITNNINTKTDNAKPRKQREKFIKNPPAEVQPDITSDNFELKEQLPAKVEKPLGDDFKFDMPKFNQQLMGLYGVFKKLEVEIFDLKVKGDTLKDSVKTFKEIDKLSASLNKLKQQFVEAGLTAQSANHLFSGLEGELKTKKGFVNESEGNKGGLVSSISKLFKGGFLKTIGARTLSRGIFEIARGIVKMLSTVVKNAISSIYNAGGYIRTILDKLASYIQLLTDAFGALLVPAIEILVPILNVLVKGIAYLVNGIAKLIQTLLNTNTKTELQEVAKSFSNANKSVGIDELNVIGEQSGLTVTVEVDGGDDFNNLIDSFRELSTLISGIILIMQVNFAKVFSIATTASTAFGTALTFVTKNAKSLFTIITGVVSIITNVIDIWNDGITVGNALGLTLGVVATAFGVAKLSVDLFHASLLKVFALTTLIILAIASLVLGIKNLISNWGDMSTWQKVIGVLSAVVTLLGAIGSIVGYLTGNVGLLAVSAVATVTGIAGTSTQIASFSTGGFPEEDGLFYANHNELVGSFNGKTAVANNQEITEGIYNAVLEAMNNSDKGNSNVAVYLDSREISSKVEERINNKGIRTIGGTKLSYGK